MAIFLSSRFTGMAEEENEYLHMHNRVVQDEVTKIFTAQVWDPPKNIHGRLKISNHRQPHL